jgi:hypothetical protein
MRVYSELDLLGEELERLNEEPDSFFKLLKRDLFRGQYVSVAIEVPDSLLLRASVLCDDLCELSSRKFSQADLLTIIYDEYLDQVRRSGDLHFIYQNLIFRDVSMKPEVHRNGQEYEVEDLQEKEHTRTIYFKMRRKAALRGETLLSDLAEVFPDHPYSLEKLLEVIYSDFLMRYKKGQLKDPIKKLLEYICEK